MKPRKPLFLILLIFLLLVLFDHLILLYLPYLTITHSLVFIALSAIFLLAFADALLSRNRRKISIERVLPDHCIIGKEIIVSLFVRPQEQINKPIHITIDDCLPSDWQTNDNTLYLDLLPGKGSQIRYRATPQSRGDAQFDGIDYAVPSILGLWWIIRRLPEKQQVKVLPDFSLIIGADLMSLNRWLAWVGNKKSRRHGAGQAFHQLRDFMQGDDIRHMDWKATARAQKHIVRSYQDEKDRQLIFLLDCGRNMRVADGEQTHFDYALNALLLLSYTALKHDDAVGLMTFNHPQIRNLPARRGVSQIGKMVHAVYNLQPSLKTNDFELAINQLLQRQRRRALVVVLSHINHEDNQSLTDQLAALHRKHLLIFANLRPTLGKTLREKKIVDLDDSLAYIGAQFYEQEEKNTIHRLNSLGITHLHTTPKELNSGLINQYLKIRLNNSW